MINKKDKVSIVVILIMAIIKNFVSKIFKEEKNLLRLEKISVYFGKRKILESKFKFKSG